MELVSGFSRQSLANQSQLSLFAGAEYWLRRWTVESSAGNAVYTVAVNRVGEWGCSCPGWVHQAAPTGRRSACKHIGTLRSRTGGAQ